MFELCYLVAFLTEECSVGKASYPISMYLQCFPVLLERLLSFVFSVVKMMLDLYCMVDGYYYMVLCGFGHYGN